MLTDEKRAELEQANKRIRVITGDLDDAGEPEWMAVVKAASTPDFEYFKAQLFDETVRHAAQKWLFTKTCVWAWTRWDGECKAEQLLATLPGAAEGAMEAMRSINGMKVQERAKR